MLKIRELHEVPTLFELASHPEVFPYLRHKAETLDEFYFLTKQTIEAEEQGLLISRTILDEFEQPIGTINLFDIHKNSGFLATWIGQPYFGKGYNKMAKELFFDELFFQHGIENIFMKVRKSNLRSLRAVEKLDYVIEGNELFPDVYEAINKEEPIYHLFVITKEHYASYLQFANQTDETGAEIVS
ncbi:MAG TPA: GNAT family N-acetyltransferase [Pseudogracilibacillus sp.]|nr:GNAT family N-acetyltransferase [Pseudogracilibacillus sp.]